MMQTNAFSGVRLTSKRTAHARGRTRNLVVRADKCLIANTKGGGHAFIGYHLAKQLVSKGHSVTILNDGDKAKVGAKEPFNQYETLSGVNVIYGSPADPSVLPSESFDVVIDNNGKDLDSCKPMMDKYKDSVKQYFFVSSAGMYKPKSMSPEYVEGDEVKASAGHAAVEAYLKDNSMPYTIFRPQYIYGPYTAKGAYFDYYIDRIIRDKPVPVPAPGVQLTSLTHVEDVASMITSAVGNDKAVKQTYNMATDRYISLDGVARLVASAVGKEANIVHYDHDNAGLKKGEGFPMRTVHFICSVDKAMNDLDWQPSHSIKEDVMEVISDYKAKNKDTATVDFSADEKILA